MKLLRQYHYDPLDRLTGETSAGRASTQRFYQEDDLVTEMGDQVQLSILRHGEEPLAQHQTVSGVDDTLLLATDRAHSVLRILAGTNRQQRVYTAYGYRTGESGLSSLLEFNGEAPDAITGHYLLGQGTRAFNPILMRFNSPDELSPFDSGGINPYAYCGGDPINRYDPTGESWTWLRFWNRGISSSSAIDLSNKVSDIVAPKSSPVFSNPSSIIEPTTASIARTPSPTISTPLGSGSPSAFEKSQNSPFFLPDERTYKTIEFIRNHPHTQGSSTNKQRPTYPIKYDMIKRKVDIGKFPPPSNMWNKYQSALRADMVQKQLTHDKVQSRRKSANVTYYRQRIKREVVLNYKKAQAIRTKNDNG
jgi:RHS repeat-associated protein